MPHSIDRNLPTPWWEQILRGEKAGLFADSVRQVARLGSLGYGAGVRGRELAYRKGWLKTRRLPQPTVCIGNITVGGTGKTPLVIRLASDLLSRGLKPAVLLRGYKREKTNRKVVLVRNADRVLADIDEAGDEAMELARRLNGCCVGVGSDRYAVGQFVLERNPVNCFILDDGFQHHRLERDINVVTIDVTDPWGGGNLLPAGLLREPPDALRRADAVVLTRTGAAGPDRLSVLREQISAFMRPSSCILESRHEAVELVSLDGKKRAPLSELKRRNVLVVSGIGNPQSFERTVSALGAIVIDRLRLTDHGGSVDEVLSWIRSHRSPGFLVVMTEKDAMRWTGGLSKRTGIPGIYALRMNLALVSGQEHWDNLINIVNRLVDAKK